jgi:hypothetical protein
MNITQLIFLRPRETPQTYKDEGHSLEIGLIPLQTGIPVVGTTRCGRLLR